MRVPSTTIRKGIYYLNIVNRNRENCRFSLNTSDGDIAYKRVRDNFSLIQAYRNCNIDKKEFCEMFCLPKKEEKNKPKVKRSRTLDEYYCEECSNDILVTMGLCSGKFTIQRENLKRGSVPCRCSGHFRYTKDQLTFLIQKRIKDLDLNYTFLGWHEEDGEVSTKSSFKYCCDKHGVFSTKYYNFMRRKSCCPICAGNSQTRAYINLVSDQDSPVCLKFGISYSEDLRLKQQNSRNLFKMKNIFTFEFETIKSCREAEKACKDELQCGILSSRELKDGWSETTSILNLDKIIEIYEGFGGKRVK